MRWHPHSAQPKVRPAHFSVSSRTATRLCAKRFIRQPRSLIVTQGSSEEHGAARPAAPSTEAARTQPRAGLFVPAGGDRDLDDSAPSRSCDPRELVIRLRLPGGPCGVRDERPAPGPAGTDAELGDAPIGTPMETDPAPVATVDRRRLGDVPPSCDTLVVRTRDGSVSGAGEGASTGGERVAGAGDARSGRVGGEPDLTAEEWQELYDMAGGTDWTTDVSPEEWKEMREAYDT